MRDGATPDFCVIGSGAGGSVAAAVLARAGATVIVLEEGARHHERDFNMQESWAYPNLYQDQGKRATEDLAITILQGRTVGGGTTVNWTSSFRTPPATLRLWAERHAVAIDAATLAPHFAAVEERLQIREGNPDDVNTNNRLLAEGARKLGWSTELIRRNVQGCARLGYCGMGCPLGAKRTATLTYLADAEAAGAELWSSCRAIGLETDGGRARTVIAAALDRASGRTTNTVTVRPRRGVLVAGGAINTPAMLLRARVGLGGGLVGRRTFLHPTVPIIGIFPERVEAFYGAPQSIACHQHARRGERVGYFLETAPVHPMLASIAFPGHGDAHRAMAERLPFVQATIALLIDGQGDDPGGVVRISDGGRVILSYPLGPSLVEAARDAMAAMARLLLAAGATEVLTLHEKGLTIRSEADLPAIARAPFGANMHTLFSAHQMGGCPMGEDRTRSVVSSRGRHHAFENLWVTDGSVFPTGVGVNPQVSVYAHARLFATEIARAG